MANIDIVIRLNDIPWDGVYSGEETYNGPPDATKVTSYCLPVGATAVSHNDPELALQMLATNSFDPKQSGSQGSEKESRPTKTLRIRQLGFVNSTYGNECRVCCRPVRLFCSRNQVQSR
jgi:hypothetical protein